MPHSLLPARALSAAIVVLLTVGGIVAITGTAHAEELAIERAGIVTGVAGLASGPATESPSPTTTTTAVPATPTTTTLAVTSTTAAPTPTTSAPAPASTTAPPTSAPPTTAPATTAPPTTTAPAPASGTRDTACESSMLGWMNDTRADAGLHALTRDGAIQHVSLDWSDEMARTGQLAHNPRYSDQIFAVRAEARTAGEIVGWSTTSARAVYDEFLRSPSHRDRILTRAFAHTTVGCVRDQADRVWVTVNFWG